MTDLTREQLKALPPDQRYITMDGFRYVKIDGGWVRETAALRKKSFSEQMMEKQMKQIFQGHRL